MVCGFSCKYLSRANQHAKSIDRRPNRKMNGMLKIVDKMMPEAVIFEHVDAMDDGYQDIGLAQVLQVLGDRGYDPQAFF